MNESDAGIGTPPAFRWWQGLGNCLQVAVRRIRQSTGSISLAEAEQYLARLMEESRQARIYGVRPSRTFEQAAAKYVIENQHKRSIDDDVSRLKGLMPWVGQLLLDKIHMGGLQPWMDHRRKAGVSAGTINHGLSRDICGTALRASDFFRRFIRLERCGHMYGL